MLEEEEFGLLNSMKGGDEVKTTCWSRSLQSGLLTPSKKTMGNVVLKIMNENTSKFSFGAIYQRM